MSKLLIYILLFSVGACAQLQDVQSVITNTCSVLNTTAAGVMLTPLATMPKVAALDAFIIASCGSEEAIAGLIEKQATDPSTVSWLQNLQMQFNQAVAAAKAI